MNKTEFIILFESEMDFYDEFEVADITEDMLLAHFSNWDSLSRATVYNFVQHELGITLNHADIRGCKTVGDLMKLCNIQDDE